MFSKKLLPLYISSLKIFNATKSDDTISIIPNRATTGEVHLRHHISPNGVYRGKKILKTKGE
jgi:ribosomal protein L32